MLQLILVLWRHNDDIRNRTHVSEIENTMMRWTIRADQTTTTRGDTVNRAVGLLASELVEHLKLRDPELARVVRQLVLPPSVEDETNAWLDRVHDRRTRDFGETIFKPIKRRRRRARKA